MPIATTCRGCGKVIEAPESAAGRKARCPQCGVVVVIPGEPVASAGPVGGAVPVELVAAALSRSATPSPSHGSATTIDRIAARTSPYGLLRLMAPIVFGLGVGFGAIVFLVGLASLIVMARQGEPVVGVVAFVGGLILSVLFVLGGKIFGDLLRLGADVGDKTRLIAQYLEETASRGSEESV
ncbi:MAG: hypothetical protein WBD75_11155 [Phycisphaerae bacterium]